MLRKLRLLSILLVFSLIAGQICIANVSAAEGVTTGVEVKELSGLRITDLSKPVAGRMLDMTARIRTNENVTWEIPVIWVDENGNTATVAEPGKKYYPNFAFFLPQGYSISEKQPNGRFGIKLPDFLISLFGSDSAVFVADAGKGITYITFLSEVAASKAAEAAKREVVVPAQTVTEGPKPGQTLPEGHSAEDNGGKSSGGSVAPAPAPEPNGGDEEEIPDSVRIHCSQGVIEKFSGSIDVLENLITLVKNKLEPQAVGLLKSGLYDYPDPVENSSLGSKIGLFIYYDKDTVDDGSSNGMQTPENALAFVAGNRFTDEDNLCNIYKYLIGLDTKEFMEQDPETGRWVYREDQKANLDNTVVHELMHAFMDDYTRRGMDGTYDDPDDRFPNWFIEGIASAVENVYQFRAGIFQSMGDVNGLKFDETKSRYLNADGETVRVQYSTDSVYNRYMQEGFQDPNNRCMLTYSSDYGRNTGSAYCSGYLAVVYLSYLTAIKANKGNALIVPELDSEEEVTVDMDTIRKGTAKILEFLHNGYSLDSIIEFASSDTQNNNAFYANTEAFEDLFIKGEGTNTETDLTRVVGNTSGVYASRAFVTYYLNYLESQSNEERLANGSILPNNAGQNYETPLTWGDWQETEGIYYPYQITDEEGAGGYVESDADYDRTLQTGGKTQSHGEALNDQGGTGTDPDPVVVDINETGQQAAKAADSPSPDTGNEESSGNEGSSDSDGGYSSATSDTAGESPVAEPAVFPDSSVDDATGIESIPGLIPEMAIADSELSDDGTDLVILPVQQDAIVPDEQTIAPVSGPDEGEPSGDGGSSDGEVSSDDGGSSEGGDSSEEGGSSDDGGTSESAEVAE